MVSASKNDSLNALMNLIWRTRSSLQKLATRDDSDSVPDPGDVDVGLQVFQSGLGDAYQKLTINAVIHTENNEKQRELTIISYGKRPSRS